MIRISNIKLSLDESENILEEKVQKKYGIKKIKSFRISKKSIDARRKNDVHYVYSVDVETDNDKHYIGKNAVLHEESKYEFPKGKI